MRYLLRFGCLFYLATYTYTPAFGQYMLSTSPTKKEKKWIDSVMKRMNAEQKIGQLIVARVHSNWSKDKLDSVQTHIQRYGIGGICFFQGTPYLQANLTNHYQSISKVPIFITIDAEWGVGMRLDSVVPLSRQLLWGAIDTAKKELVYAAAAHIAQQCKRLGIHINYAPVVDINNNPKNPVINDRSFGENKYKVASFGTAYIKGLQHNGIIACAKHFPGHGDVAVDSHQDLPIISKTYAQLDSLELYPFKKTIQQNVGMVMVGHLFIPALDSTPHIASSISKAVVTGVLQDSLNFKGLIITDGIDMKAITKYFPDGLASAKALIAGNDLICVPESVPDAVQSILKAIADSALSMKKIEQKVEKVLLAKYRMRLWSQPSIKLENITEDLNKNTDGIEKKLAEASITLVKLTNHQFIPLNITKNSFAVVGVGTKENSLLLDSFKTHYPKIPIFKIPLSATEQFLRDTIQAQLNAIGTVIFVLENYARYPADNFGMSKALIGYMANRSTSYNNFYIVMGNPYAIQYFNNATNILATYENYPAEQLTAWEVLQGKRKPTGRLPVTVAPNLPAGMGVVALPKPKQKKK